MKAQTYQEIANMFIASGKSKVIEGDHGVRRLQLSEKQAIWLMDTRSKETKRTRQMPSEWIVDDGEIVGDFRLVSWPMGVFLELYYIDDQYQEHIRKIAAAQVEREMTAWMRVGRTTAA